MIAPRAESVVIKYAPLHTACLTYVPAYRPSVRLAVILVPYWLECYPRRLYLPSCGGRYMAPKLKPKPKGEVEMFKPFARGRAATKSFFDDLEELTNTPVVDLKRMLDGIQKIAVRDLRSKGNFTMPAIGTFRVKAMLGATEAPMVIMDKALTRREKPAKNKVICKVATALNDKVAG